MSKVRERPEITKSRHRSLREARHEGVPLLADVERSAAKWFTYFNVAVEIPSWARHCYQPC